MYEGSTDMCDIGKGSEEEASGIRGVCPCWQYPQDSLTSAQTRQLSLPVGCQEQLSPSSGLVEWGQHIGTSP